MANRGRGQRFFNKTIDRKEWASIGGLVTSLSASIGTIIGSSLAFLAPFTILRCRGQFLVTFDETAVANDKAVFGMGLAVVSTDAATAGAGSLPEPISDPEYPWLYWTDFDLLTLVSSASGSAWGTNNRLVQYDTKAMRKVKPGQSLVWIAESVNTVGDPVLEILAGRTRVLLGS